MPFINEVLEANEAQIKQAREAKSVATTSRFLFDPDQVFETLSTRIVGQPEALAALHDMLHVVKANFSEPARPLSVQLFIGSTGVGKTEAVRVLAESVLGNPDELCRIDMNTLAQEHYSAALIGAPPGYVGSKENHTLFNFDKVEGSYSRPGVVLLDELEKADDAVVRALLNVFDTGSLTLSAGTKSINFRNAMVFMTSNIGARELAAYRQSFTSGWRKLFGLSPNKSQETKILRTALEGRFDPEFINRIDQVVYFNELNVEWLDSLLLIELSELNKRLSKRGVSLTMSPAAQDYVLKLYDSRYGARDLKRSLRRVLEPALARAINQFPTAAQFTATYENQSLAMLPHQAPNLEVVPAKD